MTSNRLIMWMCLVSMIASVVMADTNLTSGSSSFDKAANDLFSSAAGIKWAPGLIAGISLVGGLVVAFMGYKLFRPVMFICGFSVGAVLGYLVAERIFQNQSYVTTAAWIAFFVIGFALGSLVINIWQCGVFLVGAAAGVLLACEINTSIGYKIYPSNPTTSLIILVIALGIICGALALWLERPALIVATSFFGAVAAVWGLGYFAGKYPSSKDLESWRTQAADGTYSFSLPSAWWYYLIGTIILFVISLFVQLNKTAFGIVHSNPRQQ
ncbi:hypothetical protein THRCLA_05833 [Thraustotheca clavata]|uniref:Transmembrane protein 198 n=1 Tax=Thraustotheca clavata TaxID=74557 RepID=A0A1V9ZS66_9STRA|nr:hypothetical protein THRCLA_05833 [Thraustotheca clavata]